MDFFSEKELITQTGHAVEDWPLVILKELVDNSLDACEEVDIAPVVLVTADAGGITVADNGPGLPESTLRAAMDFTIRASNREAYVAPDRGTQGNALMTMLSMPTVIDPEHGKLILEVCGKRHVISCNADPISGRPVIRDDATECRSAGTKVRIEWARRRNDCGETLWPFGGEDSAEYIHVADFHHLLEGFALFNPHASFHLKWFGSESSCKATDTDWRKWKPNHPTSAHWYEPQHFKRLIGAYITHDRDAGTDRLVSKFVSEFDGLSGSQKQSKVLRESDLRRVRLSELVTDGDFDGDRIARLLAAMQRHTRPIKPERLGIIGEDHLRARLLAMGVVPNSFEYSRKLSKSKKSHPSFVDEACFSDEVPWVVESAFGWLGKESLKDRKIYSGANWSAAIHNPFRTFGSTGEGLEAALTEMKVGQDEPVVYVLHLAHPRIEYTDRGKSALVIGGRK